MAKPTKAFAIGVQSYCYRKFDFGQTARYVKELGLKNIEFCPIQITHELPRDQVLDRKKQLADMGLHQSAYGVVRLTKDVDANRPIFEYCKLMDTRVISADPDRNAFDTLDKLVAEYDMCIGIHNHGAKHRWKTGQQMLDAVKDHDPRIGACLDTAWSIDAGDDPVAAIRLLGPRMHDIHVKDSDGTEDVIPGQGRLDLAGTIKALADVDFDGPLTVEYENHPENVQPWMIKCVAAVRAAIAKL